MLILLTAIVSVLELILFVHDSNVTPKNQTHVNVSHNAVSNVPPAILTTSTNEPPLIVAQARDPHNSEKDGKKTGNSNPYSLSRALRIESNSEGNAASTIAPVNEISNPPTVASTARATPENVPQERLKDELSTESITEKIKESSTSKPITSPYPYKYHSESTETDVKIPSKHQPADKNKGIEYSSTLEISEKKHFEVHPKVAETFLKYKGSNFDSVLHTETATSPSPKQQQKIISESENDVNDEEKLYGVQNSKDGLFLTIITNSKSATKDDLAKVGTEEWVGSESQKWAVVKQESGYVLIPKSMELNEISVSKNNEFRHWNMIDSKTVKGAFKLVSTDDTKCIEGDGRRRIQSRFCDHATNWYFIDVDVESV